MVKTPIILAAALALPAGADAYTLAQAHRMVVRYEQHQGFSVRNVSCHWHGRSHRVATCAVDFGQIDLGFGPRHWLATDVITRSGPCSIPVTKRTSPTSGIASGTSGATVHNCYNGPLLVLPLPYTLRSI